MKHVNSWPFCFAGRIAAGAAFNPELCGILLRVLGYKSKLSEVYPHVPGAMFQIIQIQKAVSNPPLFLHFFLLMFIEHDKP